MDFANHDSEFTNIIITGDEIWVYDFNQKLSFNPHDGSICNHEDPKTWTILHDGKVTLTCFFDFRCIVHHHFAPESRAINRVLPGGSTSPS